MSVLVIRQQIICEIVGGMHPDSKISESLSAYTLCKDQHRGLG